MSGVIFTKNRKKSNFPGASHPGVKKKCLPPAMYEGPFQIEQTLRIWKEDDASFLPLSPSNLKHSGTSKARGKCSKKSFLTFGLIKIIKTHIYYGKPFLLLA